MFITKERLKKVENLLRRHNIEADEAFYTLGYFYAKHGDVEHEDYIKAVSEKGLRGLEKINRDNDVVKHLISEIESDIYGENLPIWYQYFLSRKHRGTSGKFFTPKTIAKAMASLLPVKDGAVVMDPTCGGGTFLMEASDRWNGKRVTLIGNDIDETLVDLTRLVTGLGTPSNHRTDFIQSDLYEPDANLKKYHGKVDYILANPPFSLPITHLTTPSDLFSLGYKTSDTVFLDICYDLLKSGGILVCLLPHSIIANKEYAKLREEVEKKWHMVGVLGMPEGIFYVTAGTTARADIIMIQKKGLGIEKVKNNFFGFAPSIGIPLNSRATDNSNSLQEIVDGINLSRL